MYQNDLRNPISLRKKGRCEAIVKRLIIEDGLLLTDMELIFRGQALCSIDDYFLICMQPLKWPVKQRLTFFSLLSKGLQSK
jgi:hypothetical protein